MKTPVLLLWLSLLTGCATVPLGDARQDETRKQFVAPRDNAGLFIYRNEGLASAIRMDVQVNGQNIGQTVARTYLYQELAPGTHRITSTAENTDSVDVTARPGQLLYVWQEVKMGMMYARNRLHIVSDEEGRKGVSESRLAAGNQSDGGRVIRAQSDPGGAASRQLEARADANPVGGTPSPPAAAGGGRAGAACPQSIAYIEPRLPVCRDHAKLLEMRQIALATDVSFREDLRQGYTLRQVAVTAAKAAREYDQTLVQNQAAMFEAAASRERAQARLDALRASPPRCDANDQAMGMSESAYQAYVAMYIAGIVNTAVSTIAACRARSAQ